MQSCAFLQQPGRAAAKPYHATQYHAQLQSRTEQKRHVKCLSARASAETQAIAHADHMKRAEQAVVIGSGIAGLAAAEVLSKHFSRVLVLEKDKPRLEWEQSAVDMVKAKGARRGVTQYNHLHGITAGGLQSLNTIFQGRFTPALLAGGGVIVNLLTEGRSVLPKYGATLVNHQAKPLPVAFCTRHLFEQTARKLVHSNEHVEFIYGASAAGLAYEATAAATATSSTQAVTGVRLKDGRTLPAALVVDASGRHSQTPDWLTPAGYDKPRVSTATANCGYASMLLKLAPAAEAALSAENIQIIYCMAQAPTQTLGILVRVEGGLWMAGIGGYQGKHPPLKDDDKLIEWAQKEIWQPEFGQLLAGSTRITPPVRFYGVGSTWHHYEESAAAGQLPEGLVPLADSICSFNPVYGQGMSVAGREVQVLDRLLTQRRCMSNAAAGLSSDSLVGLSAQFQRHILPIVQSAWDLAVGSDMRFEGAVSTEGGGLAGAAGRFQAAYQDAVFELATKDPMVHEKLMQVMHMVEEPAALTSPAVLGKVIMHKLTAPFRLHQERHYSIFGKSAAVSDDIRRRTGHTAHRIVH